MAKSKLKVEYVPIAKLTPFAGNPRKNEDAVDSIIKSIEAFGYTNPILARRENNEIIAGHTRILALQRLGATEAPVIFLDLSETDARVYSVFDNKSVENTEWDFPKLADLFTEFDELNVDLDLTGFSAEEIENIVVGPGGYEPDPQDDEVPDVPKKAITKPGDLWLLGDHRLLCGDATKAEDVARLLGKDKPPMMVTDPPYGVNYNPEWRNEALAYAKRRVGKVANDDRIDWGDAYDLFPGDIAYVWSPGGDSIIVTGQVMQRCGFEIRNQLIWRKPHFPISRGHYTCQHEPFWYCVRRGAKARWCGPTNASTVWEVSLDRNIEGGHSTQKPVELMARAISHHGKAGDGIYEPFCGSGTTLIACEKLERKCYAIEIEPVYCDVIVERWQQFTGGKAGRG